ncbi:MAG: homoserine O-succinyltransferase [gamma proteobacterium symbiont of Bathyaustriella thionipta]|nr:homoserine O-succinyltransferase [gamma proteobacterium symbiont of Bathyaustriella thionipta]MCU7951586.1 homoserine O-succinyltransferase [gamma proteobacterium symbiont of Bathyaustriella thionipta]MCU7953992.1 homoserine O-succinyltransferase [gamma proteobacterium symbiont of Bathyaustriella thionipta]MCU7958188.1 homoserine O-succinyltransferase [gamma proteobacterium symbiont of Bathyaustriella thionipta]MCU7968345.1 homoserine O-succinyltransferase [gamma proteobacterium symbiont of 
MPLVAHNQLPSFSRLRDEGIKVLTPTTAQHQDIRELHIGLLNMMPDTALAATERQFFRLVGESNPIAQFYVHPFTLDEIPRSQKAKDYLSQYYESFADIKEMGLDALIITGANVTGSELSSQPFWEPLIEVFDWAWENVTSTLCSCLATHAVMEFRYSQKRKPQCNKTWGVFPHHVLDKHHPLINDINTRFDVPHSRWNAVSQQQFKNQKLKILVESDSGFVHLATSPDGFRHVLFQGHPEYDAISLLKEYKRETMLFNQGKLDTYPPFPANYLGIFEKAILNEYRLRCTMARQNDQALPEFPETLVTQNIDITWHDTAVEVIGNWMGLIYQLTHKDRHIPFMDSIDDNNPLSLAE